MKLQKRKALKALIAVFAFVLAQICVSAALPAPPTPNAPVPQQLTARLTTKNNQPITVNGNSVGTGGTILTGATIETPDQVSATIDLGAAGTVEVGPNSVIKLEYDANGNVHVKVIKGCALTKQTQNVLPGEMEVYTDTDSKKTDKNNHQAGGCILPNGQLGSFSAGAGGLSGAEIAGIVAGGAGTAAVVTALTRGGTTSPSSPNGQQ